MTEQEGVLLEIVAVIIRIALENNNLMYCRVLMIMNVHYEYVINVYLFVCVSGSLRCRIYIEAIIVEILCPK